MKKMIIAIVLPFLTLLCSYSEEGSEGQRNEPIVQLGDTHHLEIISLVEKYRRKGKGPVAP